MDRYRSLTGTFVLAATCATTPLSGQLTDGRSEGLWWEVSASAGGARLSCDICDTSRDLGPALSAAFGAYASPRLRVGVEAGSWTSNAEGERESVHGAGVVTQLHPRPQSGFHVIGGLGWLGYRTEDVTYDGVRLTLGAGWDLPLTEGWTVGNRVTLAGSSYAALKSEGSVIANGIGLSVLRFGVYLRKR